MSRDNRKQVRLTDTEMANFTAHCGAMGIAPGTMLRHLVLGWLAQRSADKLSNDTACRPVSQCTRCTYHYFTDTLTNGLCYHCAEEATHEATNAINQLAKPGTR